MEAHQKLEQAKGIDPTYSDVYSLLMFILTEKIDDAIDKNNEEFTKNLVSQLDFLQNKALEYMDNTIDIAIVYKNTGKGHYLFGTYFLEGRQSGEYLKNNCLPILEKYLEARRNNKVILDISQQIDLDEGDCLIAQCYQKIFETLDEKNYKKKAIQAWKNNPFNPYTFPDGHSEENIFKEVKKSWYGRLRSS